MRSAITAASFVVAMSAVTSIARADCVSVRYLASGSSTYEYPLTMTYDTAIGVTLSMRNSTGITYTLRVSKLLNSVPNPDLDRLYGVMLKAMPTRQFSQICATGRVADGAVLEITSVTIADGLPKIELANVPKVRICDDINQNRCVGVDEYFQLKTSR